MNRCPNCSVDVHQKNCPLCGHNFNESALSEMEYPPYIFKVHKKRDFINKLFLVLIISVILITSFINIFTFSLSKSVWSLIVCASLGFAISILFSLKSKKINIGGKTLRLFTAFSLFIFIVDIANGFLKWSTTYVIPFTTVAIAILFTVFAFMKKNNFKEYFGYLLATAFISICPIALFLLNLSSQLWSSLIATLTCIIISVFLYIFVGQSLKGELKKRFHT